MSRSGTTAPEPAGTLVVVTGGATADADEVSATADPLAIADVDGELSTVAPEVTEGTKEVGSVVTAGSPAGTCDMSDVGIVSVVP